MKLTIIGGGGIRTPLFIDLLAHRQMFKVGQRLIDRVTLMDIQPERLEVILKLSEYLKNRIGGDFTLDGTTDLATACEDADFIITTMRVGFEQGRVIDENVAMENQVIGQETTGPGGFAMAMRSIPEALNVAQTAREICPKAWIINFTNPAGIVSQAVHDAGYDKVVGVCDCSDSLHMRIARSLDESPENLDTQVFGLNHCSLTTRFKKNGEDILPYLLSDDTIFQKHFPIFQKEDLLKFGGLPNEYLYYYLYPKKAFSQMSASSVGRGESILEMNRKYFESAKKPKFKKDIGALFALHNRTMHQRHSSYMDYAWENTKSGQRPKNADEEEAEGYAGVAMDFMEAVTSNKQHTLVLNVPPKAPIAGLSAHEVVEVTCKVSRKGVKPVLPETVPEPFADLIRRVKVYESLTCQAVRQKSKKLALWALEANPLVGSKAKAKSLLEGYTKGHGGIFEELK